MRAERSANRVLDLELSRNKAEGGIQRFCLMASGAIPA